jgi:hypothetical protein
MEQEQKQTTVNTNTEVNTENSTNVEQMAKNGTNVEVNEKIKNEISTELKGEDETKENHKDDIMIPKKRFDEINNKYKQLAKELQDLKDAQQAKSEVKEEPKEEVKEVKEDVVDPKLKDLEKQIQSFQTIINDMYESKLKTIPVDMQELIPEGLTIEQKLAWINKAEEKGLFKKKTMVEIGQPLNHSTEQSKQEKLKKLNPIQLLASYYGEK